MTCNFYEQDGKDYRFIVVREMGFELYMSGMLAFLAILAEVSVSGMQLFGIHMRHICIYRHRHNLSPSYRMAFNVVVHLFAGVGCHVVKYYKHSTIQQFAENVFQQSNLQWLDTMLKTSNPIPFTDYGAQGSNWWDTYKNIPNEYEVLEKKYNEVLLENKRLTQENKRYERKLAKARTLIKKELKRPLQAEDRNYPFAIDAKDYSLQSALDRLYF